MHCSGAQRELEAYLSAEMGERQRARLERHLAGCVECGRALGRARQLRLLLGGERTPAVPGGFHARLMARARLQAAKPAWGGSLGRLRWAPAMPPPLRAAAVGAAIVALGAGVLIGRDMWQPEQTLAYQQAQLAAADPVRIYRIDYLDEAPEGSLAGAYLSLASGGGER